MHAEKYREANEVHENNAGGMTAEAGRDMPSTLNSGGNGVTEGDKTRWCTGDGGGDGDEMNASVDGQARLPSSLL